MSHERRLAVTAVVVLLVAGAAFWFAPANDDAQRTASTSPATETVAGQEAAAAPPIEATTPPALAVPEGFDHVIGSGATLAFDESELAGRPPLVIALDLEVASANDEARPVRVISDDGRVIELEGPVDAATRTKATLRIDPEWLTPGRYVVEVKTTERSHFPLRRYVIEVSGEGVLEPELSGGNGTSPS